MFAFVVNQCTQNINDTDQSCLYLGIDKSTHMRQMVGQFIYRYSKISVIIITYNIDDVLKKGLGYKKKKLLLSIDVYFVVLEFI